MEKEKTEKEKTIKVQYNGEMVVVPITEKTSVTYVINKLIKTLNIEASEVKLIHKGKTISKSNSKITGEGVKYGDKLLLTIVGKKGTAKRVAKTTTRKKGGEILIPEEIQLPEIAKKGPPKGAMEGLNSQVSKLPKEPFIVYTNEGKIAYLSVETDALFITYEDGTCERLFDVDYNTKSCAVPGFDGYISLFLKTKNGTRVYHYIPKQYQSILQECLTSFEK